jgi:DMSO/TMAO reductase YedYZ molybdopterin-dependent catalytic subunit
MRQGARSSSGAEPGYTRGAVTPRGTDWGLAALVGLLFVTGVLSLFAGTADDAWVFVVHDIAAAMLAVLVVWKLRRVWGRVARVADWDGGTPAALLATALVAATLASGWIWSSGGNLFIASYNLLDWHYVLGVGLTLVVLLHAALRAKALRSADVTDRRQFLQVAGLTAAAGAVYLAQRPVARLLGWRGGGRRFTGSYEAGSYAGNAFPSTSWVADDPRPIGGSGYRLAVSGRVERPVRLTLPQLEARDALEATLDCTGGFYSRQRWRGIRLDRLLAQARPSPDAGYVRVISHTGYRWGFPLADAPGLLLATHVGGEALAHEHGSPLRLVAPGRRGFQWVKWVTRIEVHVDRDPGAPASTVWSSLTPEGRGAA